MADDAGPSLPEGLLRAAGLLLKPVNGREGMLQLQGIDKSEVAAGMRGSVVDRRAAPGLQGSLFTVSHCACLAGWLCLQAHHHSLCAHEFVEARPSVTLHRTSWPPFHAATPRPNP